MVTYVKVKKEDAQKVRKKLLDFNPDYPVKSDKTSVYFPVKNKSPNTVTLQAKKRTKKPTSVKQALAGALTEKEHDNLVKGFDIVGSIAIIEISSSLEKKKKLIGKAVMDVHKNVKTVFKKKSGRQGIYRIVPLELIAGKENYETLYTEHGVRMKFDVSKVYFSPRLSEERRRITSLVKEGEVVAGLFAGVGPFPLVIAKAKKCTVYSVELNPVAVDYMRRNIGMNQKNLKGSVIPVEGDVRKVVNTLPKCDRVIMPLPKGGADFLDSALVVCKPGGTIHFYQFAEDQDLYSDALKKIVKAGKRAKRKIKVLNKKVVRPYAPRKSQVVIDFRA